LHKKYCLLHPRHGAASLVHIGCGRHDPFARLGTDTFLTVSPGGIIFYTADANVISQVIGRGTEFPKATGIYRSADIYGKSIVSTEGAAWRHHRKLTSPLFTEKNNQLVWEETLDQSQAMLISWSTADGNGKTIRRVAGYTMRLSLNVISRTRLNQNLAWLKETEVSKENSKDDIPDGHTMSFIYSLQYLLSNVLYVMVLPKSLLSTSILKTPSPAC